MKFLHLIEKQLALIEADQTADAAMPVDDTITASDVDNIAAQSQDQIQQNVKVCADTINGLIVFVRGKFADQIDATPGLNDQLKAIEEASAVTDISKANIDLLKFLYDKVGEVKGL